MSEMTDKTMVKEKVILARAFEAESTAKAERSLEAAGDRMDREMLLRNAKTLLGAAMDALELAPSTAAALIPKAHQWALKYARASGEE